MAASPSLKQAKRKLYLHIIISTTTTTVVTHTHSLSLSQYTQLYLHLRLDQVEGRLLVCAAPLQARGTLKTQKSHY